MDIYECKTKHYLLWDAIVKKIEECGIELIKKEQANKYKFWLMGLKKSIINSMAELRQVNEDKFYLPGLKISISNCEEELKHACYPCQFAEKKRRERGFTSDRLCDLCPCELREIPCYKADSDYSQLLFLTKSDSKALELAKKIRNVQFIIED